MSLTMDIGREETYVRTCQYHFFYVTLRLRETLYIRVLEVHGAKGLDSVMQLVSNERGYRETILTFGTRVWIRGCARIEGGTILINLTKICEEIL